MTDREGGGLTSGIGTLTPERFARVRAIFEAALAQPARDRQGFVKGACAGDAVLLREVEAMLAADATGAPLLDRPASTPSSSAPEEGRFPAGTVLAGRYRILGRLGQGGMGEVYRAHDLILNQLVALKFLAPAHLSEAALARFRNEVRIARQVSHPNVCRVYDLGMVEGLHFLSMEYIDGEDLASLLRRIGRLPQDKAIEFTRKICAGLGAAHERGVLHRDLKPANIMIDGRGQPRITDFGLAGLAAEIPLSDLRSGTPAYMSPEQKAGKDVTTRSDIYSLGLVLHEMFTGKARKDTQSSPSELVKDLDPAIERLILRCLEEDPKRRPSSALNVAMALPGADPVAAALAAGETPSPEMVAASQEKEGLSVRAAVICFAAVLLLIVPAAFSANPILLTTRAPLEIPPDALAFRSTQVLQQLGYPGRPADTAYGFDCCNGSNFRWIEQQPERDAILPGHQPPVARFWYRQHRRPLTTRARSVAYDAPANDQPGMIRLALDGAARLIALEVRPSDDEGPPAAAVDATALFEAAGLDRRRFSDATPRLTPPMAFDVRLAWMGRYRDDLQASVRVEAAWWRGRPVFFEVIGDWVRTDEEDDALPAALPYVLLITTAVAAVGALLVAWRNLRAGRGDRRGAAFVARVVFVCGLGQSILLGPRVVDLSVVEHWIVTFAIDVLVTLLSWVAYVAIEPFVRRQTPDALISWTRLQSARLRDSLVASHALVGIVVMLTITLVGNLVMWLVVRLWVIVLPPDAISSMSSTASFAGRLLQAVGSAFTFTLIILVLALVFRATLRRTWLADVATCLVTGAGGLYAYTGFVGFVSNGLFMYATLMLLRRFGYLAMFVAWWTYFTLNAVPASFDAWYSGWSLFTLGLIVGVAAWALWVILSDKRQPLTELTA
ncbi:MAG TPA: serine/threonine-protein kinase [Vicinamibacterales bacterium]|nr:serine/threonine-protein kinase [Vicinamibacterales bacterium]